MTIEKNVNDGKTQNIDGGTPKYSGFSHLSK